MDRFNHKFLSQVQKIQKNLEEILSQDWGPRQPQKLSQITEFEVQTDLQNLESLGWSLPTSEPEKSRVLFLRLSQYFEAGLELSCLQKKSSELQTWTLEAAFDQGQPVPLIADDFKFSFELQPFSLVEVRRVNMKEFLQFRKQDLFFLSEKSLTSSTALLLRPAEDKLWLLVSNLPDLFLKNHVSQIHEKTIRLLSDLTDDL